MTISSEDTFRLTLLAMFGITMSVVGYHRLQAAKSGDRISRREEGLLLAIALRLAGLALWIGTFAYLISPNSTAWSSLPLPNWLRWSGAVFGGLGCALIWWTLRHLGKNLTDTVVTRAQATLVTSGPYRWIRHPFYVSAGLLLLADTLLTANWLIGVFATTVMLLLAVRTPKEEQKLLDAFGEEYRSYRARTGAFWPKW